MGPWSADAIEWTERAEVELARHHVSPTEVEQVFMNDPRWFRNKKRRAGNYMMKGRTDGGRSLTVVVRWDEEETLLRVITGWEM